MEGREDLHHGQLSMAFVGRRSALHTQSWRRDRSGSALARIRAGDQIPLGEKHPDSGVSSEIIFLFFINTSDESISSSIRAHCYKRL